MTTLIPARKPSSLLYWSAPFVADGDFAPEDPLALDYVAQQMGNLLLPTLTTRTTRAQSYAMVLFGLDLAERARVAYRLANDDAVRVKLFERWERFWCLSVIESHHEKLDRQSRDSMRGVRGANRHWFAGDRDLPLDFQLISRQAELGSLGAYLSSLRENGLVGRGTLLPTPAAAPIVSSFWAPTDEASDTEAFRTHAMGALDPSVTTTPRKGRKLRLETIGQRTRLTALDRRSDMRSLLDAALLRSGDTGAFSLLAERAAKRGVAAPVAFFDGAAAGEFGGVEPALSARLRLASALSSASKAWIDAFNALYKTAASVDGLVPRAELEGVLELHRAGLVDTSSILRERDEQAGRFLPTLPVHGSGFRRLADEAADGAGAAALLDAVLDQHTKVQKERRGARGWLVPEGSRVRLELSTYTGGTDTPYPDFKLRTVLSLLRDVGRVPHEARS